MVEKAMVVAGESVIRVALDAMGGDHGHRPSTIEGAIAMLSREQVDIEIVMVGDEAAIRGELSPTHSPRCDAASASLPSDGAV